MKDRSDAFRLDFLNAWINTNPSYVPSFTNLGNFVSHAVFQR